MSHINDYAVKVLQVKDADKFEVQVQSDLKPIKTLKLMKLVPIEWQPTIDERTGQVQSRLKRSMAWSTSALSHVQTLFDFKDLNNCRAEVLREFNDIWVGDLYYQKSGRFVSLRKDLLSGDFAEETEDDTVYGTVDIKKPCRGDHEVKKNSSSKNAVENNQSNSFKTNRREISQLQRFCFFGAKPHPRALSDNTSKMYENTVSWLYRSFVKASYHDFCWRAVDIARNIFLTMPDEMLLLDENAISILLPYLRESMGLYSSSISSSSASLNAIFIVPSGIIGAKLKNQLLNQNLGFGKVKFLYSSSGDNDTSECQILILTPGKLKQFLSSSSAISLKMDEIRFYGFLYVDYLVESAEDFDTLNRLRKEVNRYHHSAKSAIFFGLSKAWSEGVKRFHNVWFENSNPLNYFLDLAEAAIYAKTKFTFEHVPTSTLQRHLIDAVKKLQTDNYKVAVFCPDDDFNWIWNCLKKYSLANVALEPHLAGSKRRMISELNKWIVDPFKQVLLISDLMMLPETGLLDNGLSVGPTALVHLVSFKDKTTLENRFQLMKPSWFDEKSCLDLKCLFLLDSLPQKVCNWFNNFLERSDAGHSLPASFWGQTDYPKVQRKETERPAKLPKVGLVRKKKIKVPDLCIDVVKFGICSKHSACNYRNHLQVDLDSKSSDSTYVSVDHLTEGGMTAFQIQDVKDGNHFSAILKSPNGCSERALRIDQMLKACYSNNQIKSGDQCRVGEVVGVAFNAGKILKRATVLRNLGISDSSFVTNSAMQRAEIRYLYRVNLIDSGSREMDISDEKLFELSPEAAGEPWLTIDVILCNIRPSDRSWPVSVIENLKEKMIGREFEATVGLVLRHHVVAWNLTSREMCPTIGDRATVVHVRDLLFSGTSGSATSNPSHMPKLVELCEQAGIYTPPTVCSSRELLAAPKENKKVLSNGLETTSTATKKQPDHPCKSLPWNGSASREMVGSVKVRISSVHTPGTFFVQREDSIDELIRMRRSIGDWVEQNGSTPGVTFSGLLRPKMMCLARLPADEGKTWSRVIIKRTDSASETLRVFALDDGECEDISFSDVCPISTSLATYPAFAIECCLAHVQPNPDLGDEHDFGEDASDSLWKTGIKGDFSRIFRVRVLDKANHGFHSSAGCYTVELTPAFELEKEAPPRESNTELSVAGQLVRLGVVAVDWDYIVHGFRSLQFSSATHPKRPKLFNEIMPNLLTQRCSILEAYDILEELIDCDAKSDIASDEFWRCIDLLLSLCEMADYDNAFLAFGILNNELESLGKGGSNTDVCDTLRRLLPLAVYLVDLANEYPTAEDNGCAAQACKVVTILVRSLSNKSSGFSRESIELVVHSAVIAVLMTMASKNNTLDSVEPCLNLLAVLVQSPVFRPWMSCMSRLRHTVEASCNRLLIGQPWNVLVQVIRHMVEEKYPTGLVEIMRAIRELVLADDDYLATVFASDLGPCINGLPNFLEENGIDCSNRDWKTVSEIAQRLNMLFSVNWDIEKDPEVDTDRPLRTNYALPRNENNICEAPAVSVQQRMNTFGQIFWSQRHDFINLCFENPDITKQTLLTQVFSGDDQRQILRLTLMTIHKSVDVYLFAQVNADSLQVKSSKSQRTQLKLRKTEQAEWPRLEALDKKLACVKTNFDRIEFDWSDDEDNDVEELASIKREILLSQQNDEGEVQIDSAQDITTDQSNELKLLEKAKSNLDDFDGDDDNDDGDDS